MHFNVRAAFSELSMYTNQNKYEISSIYWNSIKFVCIVSPRLLHVIWYKETSLYHMHVLV